MAQVSLDDKSKRAAVNSIAPLFLLNHSSALSLQEQIRRNIINAIELEIFAAGQKLPSTRRLSRELGVSRNTVLLAYQQLIAEGHLKSHERSGVFVASDLVRLHGGEARVAGRDLPRQETAIATAMVGAPAAVSGFRCPPDWYSFRYPFIEGRYDKSLFPIVEWREASRLALGAREVEEWSLDNGETDDEALIEEIRTKLLPRRGIRARRDELLITVGEQQALSLAIQLFAGAGTPVALEEPGLPEIRRLVEMRGGHVHHQPVDDAGLIVDERLDAMGLVHVSPSRQRPTGVTMSMERRQALLAAAATHDYAIIEDDFECELNYLGKSLPAMRSLEGGERVVYVASLSKVLAPGVRLGFMVAPADVIAAARQLRDLTTRRPSPNNQRAAAFFLSLGHYDAMLRRLIKVFEERLLALRDALNHYRPMSIAVAPVAGGTSLWVKGPEGLNASQLMKEAERQGVLIEPADHFFATRDRPVNMFRLGISSIPSERIREGVAQLSRAMVAVMDSAGATAADHGDGILSAEEIKAALSGATMQYKTVYGEPCTIEFHADGRMDGRAGFSHEDRDTGRWWTEGNLWTRQWQSWAYGEISSYRLQLIGNRLIFLDDSGRPVDEGLLQNPSKTAKNP